MTADNPLVPEDALSANPDLIGLRALDIFDRVVEECRKNDIMIILNLHVNKASWCCDQNDPNGLWHFPWDSKYSTDAWIGSLTLLVDRYKTLPHVVGIDIKNELHDYNGIYLTYGTSSDINTDWKVVSVMMTRNDMRLLRLSLIHIPHG